MLVHAWTPEMQRAVRVIDLVCDVPAREIRERLGTILATPLSDGVIFDEQSRIDRLPRAATVFARGEVDGDWDMDDSMTAFKSGPAGKLEELDISSNDLDPQGAHVLAESPALRELKVLNIDNVRGSPRCSVET